MSYASRNFETANRPSVRNAIELDHTFQLPAGEEASQILAAHIEKVIGIKDVKILGVLEAPEEGKGELPSIALAELPDGELLLANTRDSMSEEALQIGARVFRIYRDREIPVQLPISKDGKALSSISHPNGRKASFYLTEYEPAIGTMLTRFDEFLAFPLGQLMSRLQSANARVEQEFDLVQQIRDYTDATSMRAYKAGATANVGPSIESILNEWPEFQDLANGNDTKRSLNMFNPIPRHILHFANDELGLSSLATICRGYLPRVTANVSYDTAVAAYRTVLQADNVRALSADADETVRNIHMFLEGFNGEPDGLVNGQELFLAMKRANALDTIFVHGYLAVTANSKPMQDQDRIISMHMDKKERHLKLIRNAERAFLRYTPPSPDDGPLPPAA